MVRTAIRTFAALVTLGVVLSAASAEASSTKAKSLLTTALGDAAREKSVTMMGTISGPSISFTLSGGFSPAGDASITTETGVGTQYVVDPFGTTYCFVKATSVAILRSALEVKAANNDEINLWYKLTSKDKRYASIASPGGAHTVAQLFSYDPSGWSKKVTYLGPATLNGVHLVKLKAASNAFVEKGFGITTLYVTTGRDPLPYAMTGPAGAAGLIYFTKWGTTTVAIPSSDILLPK